MKLLIVSSPGGHFRHSYALKPWWSKHETIWVTRKDETTSQLNGATVYHGFFPEQRNVVNAVRNMLLAFYILQKEKPDCVFSAGAGIAPPFFVVAWILGIPTIFLEVFLFVPHATLSGKVIYPFATLFLVQHPDLLTHYPKAQYWGAAA